MQRLTTAGSLMFVWFFKGVQYAKWGGRQNSAAWQMQLIQCQLECELCPQE